MAFSPSARILKLALASTMAMGLSACAVYDDPYGPAYVRPAPPSVGIVYYDYWYYPDVHVYFDYNRRVYFYLSGQSWIETRTLPPDLRYRLGGYVPIHSRYQRPYIEYRDHIHKYPPRYRDVQRPPVRRDDRYDYPRNEPPPPARSREQYLNQQREREEYRTPPRATPSDRERYDPKAKQPLPHQHEQPRKEPVNRDKGRNDRDRRDDKHDRDDRDKDRNPPDNNRYDPKGLYK
ncbi:MAG: hypothetical protein GC149_09605 [Gammaproteobacteria bacterium]|nr:hypothetical protein [Gammaproteobacteria bacterium]